MYRTKRNDKLVIKILVVFVIILVLFFLNGEWSNLSFSKKINHEKFNAFFTSLGAILTASSIYFLFRQTKMIQNERKLSVQPDLFPESTNVYIDESNILEPIFRTKHDGSLSQFPFVIIHNIGLGVAKNVVGFWFFDIDEDFKEQVKEKYPLINLKDSDYYSMINVDFIEVKSKIYCRLPTAYLFLLTSKFHPNFTNFDLPELKLSLTYRNNYNDIEDKWFIVYFEKVDNRINISFNTQSNNNR